MTVRRAGARTAAAALWAAGAIAVGATGPAAAQDLRQQCTAATATEVLNAIYPAEVRQYPALAALLADPQGAPVRAAVNDCLSGREGGGRAGMQRWISIPQNRRWYWDNIVGPPLAQAMSQDLRAQCTAQNATQVLRSIYATEARSQPALERFFGLPEAMPVRAAVNDCLNGRGGGGRAGMEIWISQPQNRQWYWQNLISAPFAQWLAAQAPVGGPPVGGGAGGVIARPGGPTGQMPPGSSSPPPPGSPTTPQPAQPAGEAKAPLPSVPQRMSHAATEARHYAQVAQDFARAPALRQIPDAGDAAGFLGMAGALADLLSNPNRLASLGAPGHDVDDPLGRHGRLAIAHAAAASFGERIGQHGLQALFDAQLRAAWHAEPAALQPVASWRERSLALVTDDRIYLPEIREFRTRVDWSRFDKAETLFLMIELSRALKTGQRNIKAVGDLAQFIQDTVDKFPGLEEMPIPTLQAALKTIAVTAVVAEITTQVIEGSVALMPGRIDEFYVRINGTDRRPRDPALTIDMGAQTKLEVFLTYTTNGGKLATPWYLLDLAVPVLLRHPKVSRAVEAAKARAGAAAANLERQIEARIKGDGYAALKAELERLYRSNQGTIQAQGQKFYEFVKSNSPEFTISTAKRTTDINSDRVLFMESNSPNLLEIRQTGEHQFFLVGKADSGGKEAGYHVALKRPLLQRMVMLDDRTSASPNLRGTVIVNDPKKQQPPKQPRIRLCADGAGSLDEHGQCWPFR